MSPPAFHPTLSVWREVERATALLSALLLALLLWGSSRCCSRARWYRRTTRVAAGVVGVTTSELSHRGDGHAAVC